MKHLGNHTKVPPKLEARFPVNCSAVALPPGGNSDGSGDQAYTLYAGRQRCLEATFASQIRPPAGLLQRGRRLVEPSWTDECYYTCLGLGYRSPFYFNLDQDTAGAIDCYCCQTCVELPDPTMSVSAQAKW